jgi:DNA polymerase-4
MDAFFASVEIRDDPSLRGKPVLVGGVGRRGVIAAASYEARKFGCRSAMPTAEALRRCPQAIVLPSRFAAYEAASATVFSIFERFTPLVEPLSIDEAFLDLGGTERLWGEPRKVAEQIRAQVLAQTQLTCSVGISTVKFIAKIASARHKPDGLTEVPPGEELAFLTDLPIAKLWGVGPRTEAQLRQHGVRTVGDLRTVGPAALMRWFGEHGRKLDDLAHARDERAVVPGHVRKQVGQEDTFADDAVGRVQLRRKLLAQATRVADRLVAKGLRGRQIQIKIRDTDFRTESRQCTLPLATRDAKVIYAAACELLGALQIEGRRFRLTGVSVAGLERPDEPTGPVQLDLLAHVEPAAGGAGADPASERLQDVMSAVRERFGDQALFPADAGPDLRPGSAGGFTKSVDADD